MTKILVVYFSRTGFTRTIARQIARACLADLEPIEDEKNHSHFSGYVRSAIEAVWHRHTPIRYPQYAPGEYDIVAIGSPIWCWNLASPVRAYLNRHRREFRRIAFFCTYGGAGQAKVLRDMQGMCGRPPLATLAVSDRDISGKLYYDRLSRFAAALRSTSRLRRLSNRDTEGFGSSSIGL